MKLTGEFLLSKRTTIIWATYLLFTSILGIVGFIVQLEFEIAVNIFLISSLMVFFLYIFALKTRRIEEIKNTIRLNPDLPVSTLVEKTQAPKELLEKLIINLKSKGIKKTNLDYPSKISRLSIKTLNFLKISILSISLAIIFTGFINTYIYAQLDPDSYKFRFWAIFSTTSLIVFMVGFAISDLIEKRIISPQRDRFTQRIRSFKMNNINVFKLPKLGFAMLSIILFVFYYVYIILPIELFNAIFAYNSPILVLFGVLGFFSAGLCFMGFILSALKINREKKAEPH